jgi:hypothetical protein
MFRLCARRAPVELPDFLQFDPVPVRARHDGWTPARQRLFVLRLACGDGAAEAARKVGRSRQTAYALRGRAGAQGFASAWDAAQAFAQQASIAGRSIPPREHAFETLFVPRFYRGKLVGYVQREDHRSALRQLAHLDRIAARTWNDPSGEAAFDMDFDDLVERAVAAAQS